jgi:hypothetical protein
MSPSVRSRLVVSALTVLAAAAPLGAQVSVLSSTVEEREVAPGQTYTGRIVIANTSPTPQAVRLYQTDYTFKADGTSIFGDPGSTGRSNAPWITPQANRVTVPPNSEITVPYAIKVPEADSLSGTYWSAIMVEGAETAPPATTGRAGQAQVGIGAVIRYAVQVATHVGKTGVGSVKFENPQAVKLPNGNAALEIDVLSSGTRGVRPVMSVELYDAAGAMAGKGKQIRGLLYPGTSLHQVFEFGSVAPGTYKAIVFADTGSEKVTAVQLTITY